MAPTYTMRNRRDLRSILRHAKEEDLLRKAEMLSSSPDPDAVFSAHEIRRNSPFGVLVLFGNRQDMEREMPSAAKCDSLDEIESMISVLQAYPKVGDDFFEEKRQAYLKEVQHMRRLGNVNGQSSKERHRLENAVKNADMQRAWLEKENTDRLRKIKNIEDEIKGYEDALSKLNLEMEDHKEEIQKAVDSTGPLKKEIEEDTARLKELASSIDSLHAEQALIDKEASPTTARLQAMEEQRLTDEHNTLEMRIKAGMQKLQKIEEMIQTLRAEEEKKEQATELTASLNKSKLDLEQAQNELAGGTKMIDNLDLRVQILGGRLKTLQESSDALPEARENSRIAVLARAEELLNAWISSSKELQRILQVDGISGKELVEALFFANGPLCASGPGACSYLDGTNVSLDTLMLYGTEEEHAGFWHVEVFS